METAPQATPTGIVEEGTPNAEAVPQPQTPSEETPQGLPSDAVEFTMPDKFTGKSAEDIARAYVELEKMKAGGETPPPETPPAETPPPETPAPEEPNKYYQEFIEKGELSDESFKELEDAGYAKEDIQERLEYEKYKQDKRINSVVEDIGGIENYQAMEAWATENVGDEERAQFTAEFANASDYVKKVMLKDMYGKFQADVKEGGDIIHTNESQYTVTKGYTSQHELQKDMSDPRYGNDRSYTQAVEAKLAKSKNF